MANILGINTGQANQAEMQHMLGVFLHDGNSHQLVTPNPEIILNAQTDEELFYILNHVDLSLADGFGLKIAALISGQQLYRHTGADLLPQLLQLANDENSRVVIINRHDGLSKNADIESYLNKQQPKLNYLVIDSDQQAIPDITDIEKIKNFQPKIAICLLGSPAQEKYLFHLQKSINPLALSVGLGGAFDFLTGKLQRAPKWWRELGLEWLWRLIQQPWRWQRIWRATAVFMSKVLYWRFIMPHIYRPNVAVLMYRRTNQGKEIFIVERQGQKNHWQLPQGGLDGQDIISAGKKELQEESGVKNFQVIASYKNLYRYDFDKETGKYLHDGKQRHFGYKGQKQSLLITEFTGKDEEIIINYWDHQAWSWIPEADFITKLHPSRQVAGKIYLQKLQTNS